MFRALLAAAAAVLLMSAARPPAVDYRLGVVDQRGAPPLVEVEMRFAGDADGETRLALPSAFGGTSEAWRNLSDLKVKGASVAEDGPGVRVLRHRPGAAITVRYRVRTAYPQDPQGADGAPYKGPIIRPGWFALLGEFVFATPQGRDHEAATFQWGRLPKGWRAASDLEHAAMGRWMAVSDVAESISLAGAGLQVLEKPIPGGTLRVAAPAQAAAGLPGLADAIAAIAGAERAFWKDVREPYFVGLVPLASLPRGYSVSGSGRGDGFALYSTPLVEGASMPGHAETVRTLLAHEHMHTWIPARVGRLPAQDEAAVYWFSEGFADFFATRTLLRGGLLTPQAAVAQLDDALHAYEASPVRTAPAARVVSGFWTDPDVRKLPYQRGALLALNGTRTSASRPAARRTSTPSFCGCATTTSSSRRARGRTW